MFILLVFELLLLLAGRVIQENDERVNVVFTLARFGHAQHCSKLDSQCQAVCLLICYTLFELVTIVDGNDQLICLKAELAL